MQDDALPAAARLLTPEARVMLAPAVDAAGGELLRVWPSEVSYDPGRRLAVRYGAEITWPGEEPRVETLGALVTTGSVPEDLSVVLGPRGEKVGIWRYPHDPFLPGLPHAAYPDGAERLLSRMGLEGPVTVEPLVYRPGSRAVLSLSAGGRTVYAKVLRPRRARAVFQAHAALEGHLPTPRVLGWSELLGLVVIEALPGRPLTEPLVNGGPLPAPDELLELAERLGRVDAPEAPRLRPGALGHLGGVLRQAVPELSEDIDDLVARFAELGAGAPRLIHGDFYEAQVLVRDGVVSGLLDLDGIGIGGAGDDVANLLGHLLALAHVYPGSAERVLDYARAVEEAAIPLLLPAGVGADLLRAMAGGVLLGLATTSFRRQEADWPQRTAAWIRTCRLWADGEEALIGLPPTPHGTSPA